MSHEPPIPDAARPPFPEPQAGNPPADDSVSARSRMGLWTAAGIGIGSAAIAAALIYANRAKDKKKGA